MLCLWLMEALFQMASRTRLPNLEQAIFTYWPWEKNVKFNIYLNEQGCQSPFLHHHVSPEIYSTFTAKGLEWTFLSYYMDV